MANSTLVNINRCVGCWTCSMACKKAYGLDVDDYRMYVRTIGGGQIDTPGGKWPNLYMKWMPVYHTDCLACSGSARTGNQPFCVYNCTTEALTYGDLDDPESAISKRMEELRQQDFRIYQLHPWEKTRANVWYAEKDI